MHRWRGWWWGKGHLESWDAERYEQRRLSSMSQARCVTGRGEGVGDGRVSQLPPPSCPTPTPAWHKLSCREGEGRDEYIRSNTVFCLCLIHFFLPICPFLCHGVITFFIIHLIWLSFFPNVIFFLFISFINLWFKAQGFQTQQISAHLPNECFYLKLWVTFYV